LYDISYTFDGNSLICIDKNKKKIIKHDNAVKLLELIDNTDNNKIYIKGNALIISNNLEGYTITINECTKFFLSQYRHTLDNTVKTIKENEKKIQLNKHKNKKVVNNLVGKVGVVVAPLVMASMLATTYLKSEDLDKKYSEGIEFEQIDNQIAINDDKDIEKVEIEEPDIKEETFEEVTPSASLDIVDRSMEQEIIDIQSEYKDDFIKYGKKYGVSPYVACGLYTQESHGIGNNKGQIEHSEWEGQLLKVYNYDENKWITVVFTDTPEDYKNADITITSKELTNPSTNIAAINILLAHAANVLDTDNVFAILEYYNKGHGNFYEVMAAMENDTGKTTREVLDNPADTSFLPYSYACGAGDPNYVCNVMQYVPNKEDGGVYIYRVVDDEVKLVSVNVESDKVLDENYVKNTR
jgi:hypothetical protein